MQHDTLAPGAFQGTLLNPPSTPAPPLAAAANGTFPSTRPFREQWPSADRQRLQECMISWRLVCANNTKLAVLTAWRNTLSLVRRVKMLSAVRIQRHWRAWRYRSGAIPLSQDEVLSEGLRPATAPALDSGAVQQSVQASPNLGPGQRATNDTDETRKQRRGGGHTSVEREGEVPYLGTTAVIQVTIGAEDRKGSLVGQHRRQAATIIQRRWRGWWTRKRLRLAEGNAHGMSLLRESFRRSEDDTFILSKSFRVSRGYVRPETAPGCSRAWLLAANQSHVSKRRFRAAPPLASNSGWTSKIASLHDLSLRQTQNADFDDACLRRSCQSGFWDCGTPAAQVNPSSGLSLLYRSVKVASASGFAVTRCGLER